jgi:quercetin dioxygenase-like cupin family protein
MSTAPKPQMEAQDPVKVDPKHYKVEADNEQVRVLRVNYKAHEKSVMHSHPDNVAVFLNDAHCRFTFPDGKTEERRFRAGETLHSPAGSHLPENLGGHPIEIILVELKR